jgi:hypothetical protein
MHCSVMLSGHQYDDEGFIVSITDKFAGAGGATAGHDGVDIGGELPNGVSRWANVETHELHNPILYLYRIALVDSGGPGARRGGVTHEYALTPHAASGGSISLTLTSKGLRVPMSLGLSGGSPGSNAAGIVFRSANVDDLPDGLEATTGGVEQVQWGVFELGADDVLYQHYMGGGGYGDPLAREDRDVARDVELGVVSADAAADIYGVAIQAGRVDARQTASLRRRIRSQRLNAPVADDLCRHSTVELTARRINSYLQLDDDGATQCTWCGERFSDGGRPWRLDAVWHEQPPTCAGPERESLRGLVLRQFLCPGCATVLDSEVSFATDPPVHDDIERWPEADQSCGQTQPFGGSGSVHRQSTLAASSYVVDRTGHRSPNR